jgi:PAS domain S-box-containing protein
MPSSAAAPNPMDLLYALDEAAYIARADAAGCFLAVNQKLQRSLGYGEEEILGKPFARFLGKRAPAALRRLR